MRVLKSLDICNCKNITMSIFDTYIKKAVVADSMHSDFSGNIFYRELGTMYPLNICIPELKNEHDEMEIKK